MSIATIGGYTVGGLLGCGLSQVVGVIGLLYTGIRTIHDIACRIFYECKSQNDENKDYINNQINFYANRSVVNKKSAETFALALIPVAGFFLSASNIAKEIIYLIEGQSRQDFFAKIRYNSPEYFEILRENYLYQNDATEQMINTKDNRKIDSVYIPGKFEGGSLPEKGKTVIIFHGNGMITDCNFDFAKYLSEKGLNVLLITMGGYPGSPQNVPISETTNTYDAWAAGDFIKSKGVSNEDIFSYGVSLGSCLALASGLHLPGSHVITENAFDSVSGVAERIALNVTGLSVIGNLASRIMGLAFQAGIIASPTSNATDGMNNVERVKQLKGRYLALASTDDFLMASPRAETDAYDVETAKKVRNLAAKRTLSFRIAEAYHENHPKESLPLATQRGEHNEIMFRRFESLKEFICSERLRKNPPNPEIIHFNATGFIEDRLNRFFFPDPDFRRDPNDLSFHDYP